MTDDSPEIICVPVKLDALVLNNAVAENNDVKLSPITQPNYTFLRMDNQTIQNDVLPHTDLHITSPAKWNSRVTDLGTGNSRLNRLGVYVTWTIPRAYRSGAAGTATASSVEQRGKDGYQKIDGTADFTSPDFRTAPNRWLLIRCIDPDSVTCNPPPDDISQVLCQAWMIESDRLRTLDTLGLDVDLQVDVSPFVQTFQDTSKDKVAQQAETFIGYKYNVQATPEPSPGAVPLSVLNSANHLFADFQPHNSNVFSTVDDMSYTAGGQSYKIEKATAHYYVLGWHADSTQNPLYIDPQYQTTVAARMSTLQWQLSKGIALPDNVDQGTTICHGSMYGVLWDSDNLPPDSVAQNAATNLQQNTPVVVASSAMDGLLAYVHATGATSTGDAQQLEAILLKLEDLLVAQDDGVDAGLQARDQNERNSRHYSDGGQRWHIKPVTDGSATDGSYTPPSDADKSFLQQINTIQAALDNCLRSMQYVQRELFSIWWSWVSGAQHKSSVTGITKRVAELKQEYSTLVNAQSDFANAIGRIQKQLAEQSSGIQLEVGARQPYATQRDPTLLVGGIQTGWPHDFLDPLLVRTMLQLVNGSGAGGPWPDLSALMVDIVDKVPQDLQDAAKRLLGEFVALYDDSVQPGSGQVMPLYHDQADAPQQWRDRWYQQPWLPLFIEWEAEYFHIPFEKFTLESRNTGANVNVFEWGIDAALDQNVGDIRTVSGRMLFLPQASRTLATTVKQVIANFPNNGLSPADIAFLNDESHYYELPYLAGTMGGFYSHLTTQIKETHIKPNQRQRGQGLTPMDAAIIASADISIDADILGIIGLETGITPYGNAVSFPDTWQWSPFKPATHGQFRFRKINVIDKFGRAICALDTNPDPKASPHIAPILAEYYKCQTIPGSYPPAPNTVLQCMPNQQCEFAQVPPAINQEARLNAAFLVQNPDKSWRDTDEWENPVYGWIILNYPDNGIQFFLPDGTFYRELQLGGPFGTVESARWAPFDPPSTGAPNAGQLDEVIQALTVAADKGSYLQAFFNMASLSFGVTQVAPDDYSQFLNSVVGRPLALINMGVALELATAPLKNQSVFEFGTQLWTLLDPADNGDIVKGENEGQAGDPPKQQQYVFPIKVGDDERPYDGVVGYWPASQDKTDFDYTSLYTYWPSVQCPKTQPVSPKAFAQVSPYFVKPLELQDSGLLSWRQADLMSIERNSNWTPVSAIIDPFTPVHFYSSTLPIAELLLPHWIAERALTNMTSFFHIGPVLVTKDVPLFNADFVPNANYDLTKQLPVAGDIALPALKTGQWRWMQPYQVPIKDKEETTKTGDVPPFGTKLEYMLMNVAATDGKPRFEEAPYTAVEGYLQLSKAVASGPNKNPNS